MPAGNHRHRRLVGGGAYASGLEPSARKAETTALTPPGRLAHLSASPAELGLIGAELAKRLTFAAEEFLSELAADQVRGSFRHELGDYLEGQPEDES